MILRRFLLAWLGAIACLTSEATTVVPEAGDDLLDLHLLADPNQPTVDIVAVHGLDGHWKRSWTANNQVFWLQDLLPQVLPTARILSFSQDSRTRGSKEPLLLDIADFGKELVAQLVTVRTRSQTERLPIIFLGHSLGGLIVKQALVQAENARFDHLEAQKSIYLSTTAVVFLGTPHQGGQGVSFLEIMTRVLSVASHTNSRLLSRLQPNSEYLQDLQERYNSISNDFETTFFYEMHDMLILGVGRLLVVPKHSAVIFGARNAESFAVSGDHATIAKFSGLEDPNFRQVASHLRAKTSNVAARPRKKWQLWDTMRVAHETARPNVHTHDHGPHQRLAREDLYPAEFQPGIAFYIQRNPNFVGRSSTLQYVDQLLGVDSEPKNSTDFMLIHGIGGVGKTQVALEYAHLLGEQFSAIFWLDASSQTSLDLSARESLEFLERHYRTGGLTESPRFDLITTALRNPLEDAPIKPSNATVTRTFSQWISHEDNVKWLMILDNHDDPESVNLNDLLSTIPPGSGSVLITSRRSDLAHDWPSMELTQFSEPEAMDLLTQITRIKLDPNDEDWGHATQLAKTLLCFPLAIGQAGSYIAMSPRTRASPFEDYLRLYLSSPKELFKSTHAAAMPNAQGLQTRTVLTTWEISFNFVSRRSPEASEMLILCGVLSRNHITHAYFSNLYLLQHGQHNDVRVGKALHLLTAYSLLRYSGDAGVYTMHPLVHFWIRHRHNHLTQRKHSREALETFQRLMSFDCSACNLPYHLDHITDVYNELYPCTLPIIDMNEFINRQTTQYLGLDFSEAYGDAVGKGLQIPSGIQAWYWWARGLAYEVKTKFRQLLDRLGLCQYTANDWEIMYDLAISLHYGQHDRAKTFEWPVCMASGELGHWHPRVLEMAGNYAYQLVDIGDRKLGTAIYFCLIAARTEILGLRHPGTSGALMGASRGSVTCNMWPFLHKAYLLRREAFGIRDLYTKNALKAIVSYAEYCAREEGSLDMMNDMRQIWNSFGRLKVYLESSTARYTWRYCDLGNDSIALTCRWSFASWEREFPLIFANSCVPATLAYQLADGLSIDGHYHNATRFYECIMRWPLRMISTSWGYMSIAEHADSVLWSDDTLRMRLATAASEGWAESSGNADGWSVVTNGPLSAMIPSAIYLAIFHAGQDDLSMLDRWIRRIYPGTSTGRIRWEMPSEWTAPGHRNFEWGDMLWEGVPAWVLPEKYISDMLRTIHLGRGARTMTTNQKESYESEPQIFRQWAKDDSSVFNLFKATILIIGLSLDPVLGNTLLLSGQTGCDLSSFHPERWAEELISWEYGGCPARHVKDTVAFALHWYDSRLDNAPFCPDLRGKLWHTCAKDGTERQSGQA